jgi:hypothetical protein
MKSADGIRVEKTCTQCGNTILVIPARANRSKNNFCNMECMRAYEKALKEEIGLCACGCGEEILLRRKDSTRRRYKNHHQRRKQPIIIECACGCGETLTERSKTYCKRRFIAGHQNRKPKDYGELIKCGCGCGASLHEYTYHADGSRHKVKYKVGHHKRTIKAGENYLIDCACGCGEQLMRLDDKYRPRKYIMGHQGSLLKGNTYALGKPSWSKGKKLHYDVWNKGKHPEYMQGANNVFYKGVEKVTLVCPTCNTEFEVYPHALKSYKQKGRKNPKTVRKYCSKACSVQAQKESDSFKGENNPNWRGGTTSETAKIRHSEEYQAWRTSVFERDNYTCVKCGKRGGPLVADHYPLPFYKYPESRFDIDNGRTLCGDCNFQVTFIDREWAKA